MRKSDREVTDFNKIIGIIDKCDVLRVAFNDGEYPYVVPTSFGYEVNDGVLTFYLHGAKEGKKADLVGDGVKVCVEADIFNGYRKTENSATADYQSIIARGVMTVVKGEEAVKGITLLMEHCGFENFAARSCAERNITNVYRIIISSISAKSRYPI